MKIRKAITSIKLKNVVTDVIHDDYLRFQVEEWFENAPGFLSGPLPVEPIGGNFKASDFRNGTFELERI
jgi:hypothetical protein